MGSTPDMHNMQSTSPNSTFMDMSMKRSFYWGNNVIFFILDWPSNHLGMYILSLFILLLISIFHEWVSHSRAVGENLPLWAAGLVETLGHTLHTATGYLLMLAVMSYNLGVFIVVLAGTALGFYLFSSKYARGGRPMEVGDMSASKH